MASALKLTCPTRNRKGLLCSPLGHQKNRPGAHTGVGGAAGICSRNHLCLTAVAKGWGGWSGAGGGWWRTASLGEPAHLSPLTGVGSVLATPKRAWVQKGSIRGEKLKGLPLKTPPDYSGYVSLLQPRGRGGGTGRPFSFPSISASWLCRQPAPTAPLSRLPVRDQHT